MGKAKPPQSVKLFVGFISGNPLLLDEVARTLTHLLGPIEMISPVTPWIHTDHYRHELGTGLKRQFVFFKEQIDPERLADIKERTNTLERQWTVSTPQGPLRQVNLDPGYITPAKLVLATTKDFAHRIYIGKGIYAEVTLVYHGTSFEPLTYTYPDFRTKEYIELFNNARSSLVKTAAKRQVV